MASRDLPKPTITGLHHNNQRKIRRRLKLACLGFSLIVLLMLTATPVFAYYVVPPTTSSDNNKTTSCQRIPKSLLNRSVCSTVLAPQIKKDKILNVSVTGCGNFSQVDNDLRFLIVKLPQLLEESKTLRLLCNIAFKECGYHNYEPSNSQINCSRLLKFQNKFRTVLAEKASSCLTLPECAQHGANISNETICPKPLIASKSKYALERGLYCSPECEQANWKSGIFGASSYILMCASVILLWICNVVLFITWAKAKKLLTCQSAAGLLLLISLSTLSTADTIPLILGQKRTYCKHDSMIDSWNDPTTVCHIQGILSQFSYTTCLIWWIGSVFNTVLTVWRPEQFGRKSYKKSFLVQLTLLLLAVGGEATFSFIHDVKYARETPYAVVCSPASNFWFFYVLTLPAIVAIVCGTLMSVFVMIKLHQAKEISLSGIPEETRCKIAEEYALVQKRFFLLSIIIPLSFASGVATTIINSKTLMNKYANYSDCSSANNQTAVDRCISEHLPDVGWIGASVNWILCDLCAIALVAYCLIPKSARIVWLQLWGKCKKRQFRKRWGADMTERSSEVTQLFSSSSTQRQLDLLSENSD